MIPRRTIEEIQLEVMASLDPPERPALGAALVELVAVVVIVAAIAFVAIAAAPVPLPV